MAEITKAKQPARENRAEAVAGERRRRRDMGVHSNLRFSIPDHLRDDKSYRYHWFVDHPGRLENKTKHDDWDFVEEPEIARDGRQTGAGTRIERHAGVDKFGNPLRAFLCRKPRQYDEEDKARQRAELDKRMSAIKRGRTVSKDGDEVAGDGSYVPKGGIAIQENYNP